MKKHVFLDVTSKYISIQSYLIGRVRLADINRQPIFLDREVCFEELGKAIFLELEKSREIPEKEFMYYWENGELFTSFEKKIDEQIIKTYGYKNHRDICKDSLYLSVQIYNNILYVTPYHQDGLRSYGTVRDKSGKGIEFEYPVGLSDEELGKAVMEAFEYCTSIYKKK
ncbi:CdiI family contact-dependent growth inhibition immunity protein [Mannheimia pernigra]|uniref:CdiI family contact-dependent growth inhibition immunity protein n=1 Tax=Mannheimia pernigra TaxID=111844 RepID=A0ABD7A7L8_9PAST|nr:contact-dependent growth inhibition system immunity protein [Mannheimia pernigra]QLB42035.1 CdiI family contact-dependent growth inhibition immunity protein [Mannheimia pernigra]